MQERWPAVLEKVRTELLTPVGLRSLSRAHPDYKSRYFGDLRARDAAYHQGTVWGWLIGPFIDAWLKVHPEDRVGARQLLDGLVAHLDEACVGSISEVFDAEAPFTAARLHRPGVERRGGAAMLGKDGGIAAPVRGIRLPFPGVRGERSGSGCDRQ